MTFPADPSTTFLGWVFDKTFMGRILVINILPFMAVYTAYLSVLRFYKIHRNTIGIPAPHLRGRNTSTGDSCGSGSRLGSIAVHCLVIGVALDTGTA